MRLLLNKNILKILLLSCIFGQKVFAADLSIAPPSLTVEVGRPFTVSFYVSSNTASLNAISTQFSYPKELIKFNSFSRVGSILQMWSVEPKIDTALGSGSFEGVILNPGFSDTKGLLLKANFTPLKEGEVTIKVLSGNIYANDGDATDLASRFGKTTITIIKKREVRAQNDVTSNIGGETIGKLEQGNTIISSATHPDEGKWYSQKEALFSLTLDPLATEISTGFAPPGDYVERTRRQAVSTLSYVAKSDGTYFFYVKQKVKNVWSKDSIYKINVDTTPPSDVIATLPYGATSTKIFQKNILTAKDALSGVSHFDVSLNNGDIITEVANSNGQAVTVLPKARKGINTLSVTAYDMANNASAITLPFTVTVLQSPEVSFYTKTLKTGNTFVLDAMTYPKGVLLVDLYNKKEILQKKIVADDTGHASAQFLMKKAGSYDVSLQLVSYQNGESDQISVGKTLATFNLPYFLKVAIVQSGVIILICLILGIFAVLVTHHRAKRKFLKGVEKEASALRVFAREVKDKIKQEFKRPLEPTPPEAL